MQINFDVQSSILDAIKSTLDPSVSLADELAECLCVSKDSAYRRIRGQTLFDIADIQKITKKYNLSLDSFFGIEKSNVTFNFQSINTTDFTLVDYYKSIEKNLSIISSMHPKHLYYSARDIPIFHYFQIPELGAFKTFFWLKYYLNHPDLHDVKFNAKELPEILNDFSDLPKRIWELYLKIPCTEIWSYETPNITLRQIEFAHQTGIIDIDTCEVLCHKFKSMLTHIQNQAEEGIKSTIDSKATLEGAEYNLYFNEVAIGDNFFLFKMGDSKIVFNIYC